MKYTVIAIAVLCLGGGYYSLKAPSSVEVTPQVAQEAVETQTEAEVAAAVIASPETQAVTQPETLVDLAEEKSIAVADAPVAPAALVAPEEPVPLDPREEERVINATLQRFDDHHQKVEAGRVQAAIDTGMTMEQLTSIREVEELTRFQIMASDYSPEALAKIMDAHATAVAHVLTPEPQ